MSVVISHFFYQLLQIAIGTANAEKFPCLSEAQWIGILRLAKKHMVLGTLLNGMELLAPDKMPPRALKLKWIARVEKIKQRNEDLNAACGVLTKKIEDTGLNVVVLKGQGIAQLYSTPSYRTAGDIDLLVFTPQHNTADGYDINSSIADIRQRINSLGKGKVGKTVYHHAEWKLQNIEIELHFRAMQFNAPVTNHRLQCWTKHQMRLMQESGKNELGFRTPSFEFNAIYLMAHIYHHLLFEGVGLRQVCDYAVLLKKNTVQSAERQALMQTIDRLGMKRFAGGLMFVLQHVFGLGNEVLLCRPDEKTGCFILSEIEQAGNFGQYDARINHKRLAAGTMSKFFERTHIRMRFLRFFPREIIWDIPFRIYHFCWRLRWS